MTDSAEASLIAELERAELAARERRLAAEVQADRLLEAACASVREIEAGVGARVADALAGLRRTHLEQAEAEVKTVEAELARLQACPEHGGGRPATFDGAVEHIVAAVLAEIGA